MKTGTCRCGNRIFFNNHRCVACHAPLGRCGRCSALTSVTVEESSARCDSCESDVYPCTNQTHGVCNCYSERADSLCPFCELTEVIPSLEDPENVRRWASLEWAKRRLMVQLDQLALPPFIGNTKTTHPLRFQFLDEEVTGEGETKKVVTGHLEGLITIHLAEADSVHRERLRVELGEPHRTLIGHMRHEIGHYIDWSWASRVASDEYVQLFGDPDAMDYGEAMKRYYAEGPPSNWADNHVSAYASMHPWEDFAETVNLYLDLFAIATTSNEFGRQEIDVSAAVDLESFVESLFEIVIEVNEYNFDLGLLPLLPEQLPSVVLQKLNFVHSLRSKPAPEE